MPFILIAMVLCSPSAAQQHRGPYSGTIPRTGLNPEGHPRPDRKISKKQNREEWVTSPAESTLVDFKIFQSAVVQKEVSYHIYFPPSYNEDPLRRFPVIYWLHGSGPGEKGVPSVAHFFTSAMEAGQMPPAIVVFPNGLADGMWVDSKDGSRPIEAILTQDLMPLVDKSYRTIATRHARIIEGFSMGRYGAARLGLKHRDKFCAFSMYGAGPLQKDFLTNDPSLNPLAIRRRIFGKTYGGDASYFLQNSPWELAKTRPLDLRIRVVVGEKDHLVIAANLDFHSHLNDLGVPHDFVKVPGVGHSPDEILTATKDKAMAFYNSVLPH